MQTLLGDRDERFKELAAEIGRRHIVEVPFPLSHSNLAEAAESFLHFLTLPQETKNTFTPQHPPARSYGVPGYRLRRRGVDEARDNKEFFHYHPAYEEHLKKIGASSIPEAASFLLHAREINAAATATLKSIIEILEPQFPGLLKEYFSDDGAEADNTILRFLKYDPEGEGSFLAAAHYDVGGCTLALAESAPGLRVGLGPDTLYPIVHRSGAAFFMPALDLAEMTDQRFKPVWHDVVQLSDDVHSATTARWAIVFFANAFSRKERPSMEKSRTPQA